MGFQSRINIGFQQKCESQIENFQSTCEIFPSSPVCTSMLSAGMTPQARLVACSLTASRLQNVEWLASSQHCGYMPFFSTQLVCCKEVLCTGNPIKQNHKSNAPSQRTKECVEKVTFEKLDPLILQYSV